MKATTTTLLALAGLIALQAFLWARQAKHAPQRPAPTATPCNTIDSLYAWCRQDFLPIRKDIRKKWNGGNSVLYNTSFKVPLATDTHIFQSYGHTAFEADFGQFTDERPAGARAAEVAAALKPCSTGWAFRKDKSSGQYKVFASVQGNEVYIGALDIIPVDTVRIVRLWIAVGR